MSRTEVKKIVKKYAQALQKANYPIVAIYLFGSYVKKTHHKWSDIDVAVVSDKLKRNYDKNRVLLWDLRLGVDHRIEPHGFTVADFADDANPMSYEIRHTGIRVI
ncbi:MAG: nucleotidyltransferase domain-containing protein [Candidatus Kerfeldbacteria bacterium]|nr:nucleotidyltransferase domain-containing protein [Candidatus Kerfeldbacteria bacterium]